MMLSGKDVIAAVEGVTERRLQAWVRRGWVQPERRGRRIVYTEVDVARVRLVCHLTRHLSVRDEDIPVILSLMDQVYGLRRALRNLGRAVESQPREVRADIVRAFQELERMR